MRIALLVGLLVACCWVQTTQAETALERGCYIVEVKQIITTGIRADGSRRKPPMGVGHCAHLTDEDPDSIVAYLRTLPPR